MSDFEVRGADEFLKLSKALKQAGKTELRKQLNKGMKDAAKPLIPLTRQAARDRLPRRGGLAAQVARTPQRVQVRTGAATAGVRLVVGKTGSGARGADQGVIRHPTFGHRDRWVSQKVDAGWFTETILHNKHRVLPEVKKAMERVVAEVVRRG